MKKLALIFGVLALVGCGNGGSGGGNSSSSPYQGLWLNAEHGHELRTTGKLVSLCNEVRRSGRIYNGYRNIDAAGNVFLYSIHSGIVLTGDEDSKLGNLNGGNLIPAERLSHGYDAATKFSMSVQGDILTYSIELNGVRGDLQFYRSNEKEAQLYYQIQADCLN